MKCQHHPQDGWGGANVKQDTSWDVDQAPGAPGGSAGSGRQMPGAPNGMDAPGSSAGGMGAKETNMWGGPASANGGPPRNDGTDLWKSTLSGQPMIKQQAPPNPWDHKPQNPTDYKNWGEEDDGSGGHHGPSGGGPGGNEFWRPDQNQFGECDFVVCSLGNTRAGSGYSLTGYSSYRSVTGYKILTVYYCNRSNLPFF